MGFSKPNKNGLNAEPRELTSREVGIRPVLCIHCREVVTLYPSQNYRTLADSGHVCGRGFGRPADLPSGEWNLRSPESIAAMRRLKNKTTGVMPVTN